MATLTGTRGAANFPVGGFGAGSDLKVAYGSYTFPANYSGTDTVELCWLPKNAVVLGGFIQAADIDTGTESLVADLGWAANGVEAADTDGLFDSGVWTGDAVTDIKPQVGIWFPLGGVLLTTGPQKFSAATKVILTVTAAANASSAGGIVTAVIFYTLEY